MKKMIALLLAACMLSLALLGCGGEKTAAENPDRDQVIISISSEPESLDPCKGWGHGTTPLVQSTLVEYNQDMTFSNDLATEYGLSEDGLTWTFTIRDDVKFTDGEPLTASDVVFTFETPW